MQLLIDSCLTIRIDLEDAHSRGLGPRTCGHAFPVSRASAVIGCASTRTQFYASPKWPSASSEANYSSEVAKYLEICQMHMTRYVGQARPLFKE
jgi:hypothetical protein